MSYRPITDMWILARAKLKGGKKYYGAYLGGFPERARRVIGCPIDSPMLHVCGGHAKLYPYKGGFGELDKTLDLAPETEPDFLRDARNSFPFHTMDYQDGAVYEGQSWGGILIDPPYSEADAEHYAPGREKYPSPNLLVKNDLQILPIGGKVGIIHYLVPTCPNNAIFVACVGVFCGFNNRIRAFSVYEKCEPKEVALKKSTAAQVANGGGVIL